MTLLKPALYAAVPDGPPVLRGGRCRCGHVFFPMQTHGCERCGSVGDALTPAALAGRGRLIATARVHLHADTARPAPFTIGTIELDAGPVIRTLLIDTDGVDLARVRVEAVLVAVATQEDGSVLDLRFRPEAHV